MRKLLIGAVFAAFAASTASAQNGPVATACKGDIATYCAGKGHGDREVRTCLEDNKGKVSAACKTALDTTGGGRGPGMGRNAK
jgi:hypothetical protein